MMSLHGYVAAKPQLGLPDTGGQVVYVLELAKKFHAMGYRVDVVTRRFEGQPAIERMGRGLRVWRVPFGGRGFVRKEDMHEHLGEFVERFVTVVGEQQIAYDVVSSHYWDAGWVGQKVAEALGVVHVHTPHSLGWWKRRQMRVSKDDLGGAYRFEERIAKERWVLKRCDHVVATTHQQVEVMQEQYGVAGDRVTMIPPGLDESRFYPVGEGELAAIRRRMGVGARDVYAVGRAAMNKGYDLLIGSLPALRRLVPRARLVLATGADSAADRRRIEQWKKLASELGVAEQIVWKGYVGDEQMADAYRAAGVFALPSRYEPFGMTAAEAMACGTPAVLTVHGGLHELLEYGKQALWADPHRPEEFAAAIAMTMRYPQLRRRISENGSRWARREFGWSGIARRMIALFDRLEREPAGVPTLKPAGKLAG